MVVTIQPMSVQRGETRRRAAAILVEAFAGWPESWNTLEEAEEEVAASLGADRLSFVALGGGGEPLGWIGGIPTYHDRVWELHPLAVTPHAQRAGVGRRLVQRLEEEAAARGGLTIYLGTDDVTAMTTLGGRDLYPGVLAHLACLRDLHGHPFAFYQRLGYEVVGVVPDANGFGRPDIMMAKRIGRGPTPPG